MENAFAEPQSVVVLGGSSDIARAVVKKLCAAQTRTVVLAGRNEELLGAALREAQEYGAETTGTVLFDAEEPAKAASTVREAFDKAGERVDLVIVAVGLLGVQSEDEVDAAAAARSLTVNVTWPVAALTEVRRLLLAQGGGRILVMSSVAAVRVRRSMYLYSGAKAGLDRLCQGMAESLEGTGVTLQILRPGVVRTKMTVGRAPVPFTTGPNETAENVMLGLASGRRIIWSPPVLRYVFAVLRVLPNPLYKRLADR